MDKYGGINLKLMIEQLMCISKEYERALPQDGYDKIIRTIRGEGYSVSEKHLI